MLNLKNFLEESIATLNPFDKGKTASTVRANRKAPPAKTQKNVVQRGYEQNFNAVKDATKPVREVFKPSLWETATNLGSRVYDQINVADNGLSYGRREVDRTKPRSSAWQQTVQAGKNSPQVAVGMGKAIAEPFTRIPDRIRTGLPGGRDLQQNAALLADSASKVYKVTLDAYKQGRIGRDKLEESYMLWQDSVNKMNKESQSVENNTSVKTGAADAANVALTLMTGGKATGAGFGGVKQLTTPTLTGAMGPTSKLLFSTKPGYAGVAGTAAKQGFAGGASSELYKDNPTLGGAIQGGITGATTSLVLGSGLYGGAKLANKVATTPLDNAGNTRIPGGKNVKGVDPLESLKQEARKLDEQVRSYDMKKNFKGFRESDDARKLVELESKLQESNKTISRLDNPVDKVTVSQIENMGRKAILEGNVSKDDLVKQFNKMGKEKFPSNQKRYIDDTYGSVEAYYDDVIAKGEAGIVEQYTQFAQMPTSPKFEDFYSQTVLNRNKTGLNGNEPKQTEKATQSQPPKSTPTVGKKTYRDPNLNIDAERASFLKRKGYTEISDGSDTRTLDSIIDGNTKPTKDYGMTHRPTETGATADDITKNGTIPKDVYTNPEFYAQMSESSYRESFDALKKVRNNPEAEITVYRASPSNRLNDGDWVTLSKSYAKQESLTEGVKVHPHKVKAKDIQFAGDDINEFGYFPSKQKPTPTPFEQDLQAAGIKPATQKATKTQSKVQPVEPAASPQLQGKESRLSSQKASSSNNTPLAESDFDSLARQADAELPSFNAVAGSKGSNNTRRLVRAINTDQDVTKAVTEAQNSGKEINFFAKKDTNDRSVGIESFNPKQHRIEAGFVVDSDGKVLGNHIKVDETGIQVNVGGDLVNIERVIGNPLDWKGKYRLSETMSRNIDSNAPNKQIAGQTKDFLVGNKVKAEANYRVELQEKYGELGKRIKTVKSAKPRGVDSKQFEDDIFSVLNGDKTDADIRASYGEASKAILDYKKETRTLYDSLLERINKERVKFGQAPVEGRKDYITHLQEMSSDKKFTGEVYNALKNSFVDEGTQKTRGGVPGNIAGRTENFQPLSSWNRFLQRRTGTKSLRDPFEAVQAYLEPALYNIHMTEATVRARAVEAAFRTAGELQQMTGTDVVKYTNGLLDPYKTGGSNAKLVSGFQEYANALARKTQRFDRQIIDASDASALVLKGWQGLQKVGGRATILGNVSSALAQPLNQVIGLADAGPMNYLKGIAKTLSGDKSIESSNFIKARRTQAVKPIRGNVEKALDVGGVPLQKVEMASIEVIWNAQHAKAKKAGFTGQKAIQEADYNTERLVAGRGIADRPEAYRSTVANGLLQYTLEVNAQNKALWKDLSPKQKATFMVAAMGVNTLYGTVTGFEPLPDFLKAAIDTGSDFVDKEDKRSVKDKAIQGGQRFANETVSMNPFASSAANTFLTQSQRKTIFGEDGDMGRFEGTAAPVQVVKNVYNAADNLRQGNFTAARNDALKVVPYGNQVRKTTTGAEANSAGYSVDKSGNPTFLAPDNLPGKTQNILFGPNSTKEARDFYDNDRRALSGDQAEMFRDLPKDQQKPYFKAVTDLREADKPATGKNIAKELGSQTGDYKYYDQGYGLSTSKKTPLSNAKQMLKKSGFEGIPDKVVDEYLKRNNLSREDVQYAVDADQNTDEKLKYIDKNIKDRDQLLTYLKEGRKKSLSGDYRSNDKLLKTLYDNGVLTNNEYYGLKNIEDGAYQTKSSSSGSKSGGSKSGGKKRGKYDYKMFGLISDPITTSKSLRQLLKEASLKT